MTRGHSPCLATTNIQKFYQPDGGPGDTYYQTNVYGKNFALNNNPLDEHCKGFNYERKVTDFEYADVKGEVSAGGDFRRPAIQLFLQEQDLGNQQHYRSRIGRYGRCGPGTAGRTNSSDLINNATGSELKTDLSGYDKLNGEYRVNGDIVRVNRVTGRGAR